MAERGTRARTRRAACRVHSFVPRDGGPVVDHETVRELEKLLVQARLGRIDGLAWAVSIAPEFRERIGQAACDLTGSAARDSAVRDMLDRVARTR